MSQNHKATLSALASSEQDLQSIGRTFLGKPIGFPSESQKDALQDWGAILRAKRTAGVDVLAAVKHGLPDMSMFKEMPKTWSDVVDRHPVTIAGKMATGLVVGAIGALKTDLTKGTAASHVLGKGTEAVNSGAEATTAALAGEVLSTLDNTKDGMRSALSCYKAARAYIALLPASLSYDLYKTCDNTIDIVTDKNKRDHAIYDDAVTNAGRRWVEEMKNDLIHAGDPLDNPPKYSNIADKPMSDQLKAAAVNAVAGYIAKKTGIEAAAEAHVPPLPSGEPDKFEAFLQQSADAVQKARDAGELMYRKAPAIHSESPRLQETAEQNDFGQEDSRANARVLGF